MLMIAAHVEGTRADDPTSGMHVAEFAGLAGASVSAIAAFGLEGAAGLTGLGAIASFWAGYSAMLILTMMALDWEVEIVTGG